jgi:hypothetical protein
MSTEFETTGDDNSKDSTFGVQDDDTKILLKWSAIVVAIVVVTSFATTSLLKVIGLVSASWLWVLAAAGVSSVITLIVVLLIVAFFVASFINAIRGIG